MFSTNLFLYRVELFSLSIHNNVDIRQRMVERRGEGGGGKDENEGERSGWTAAGGEWNPVSGVEPGLRDFDRRTGFEAKRGCTAQGVPR